MRTVTLPIEEYEGLLQDQQDKQMLMEQLAAEAKDKEFLVQYLTNVYKRDTTGHWVEDYGYLTQKSQLKIFSKDEALIAAQEEINRLQDVAGKYAEAADKLSEANDRLKSRGFFARLFNLKR